MQIHSDIIAPLETILVPIFFVLMGIQVKLETVLDLGVVMIALSLILITMVGKLLCGNHADYTSPLKVRHTYM